MSLGSKAVQSRFLSWGFTGTEAKEFGERISYDAIIKSPYIRQMIRDRQLILANARQYKWGTDRILNAIRSSYRHKGLTGQLSNPSNIWALLRYYKKELETQIGQKFETPRAKTPTRKDFIETKPSDKKRQMIQDRINLLNRNIANIKDQNTIDKYKKERDTLKRQLNKL
jgi:hypothetical protein